MAKKEKFTLPFPYDKNTDTTALPAKEEKENLHLISAGKRIEAVKKVVELTGGGLKMSKDYVDDLAEAKG